MNVYISGEQLECGLLACAKQDIRFYLNGVYVECKKNVTRIVATTGHHMLVMDAAPYQDNEWSGSFIIPRDVLESIKPKAHRTGTGTRSGLAHYCITVTPQPNVGPHDDPQPPRLTMREVASTIGAEFVGVDDRFPDYTRIIPKADTYQELVPSSSFNIEYLMLALKLYRITANKKAVTVPLRQAHDQIGSVRLSENAWFFIMPMRAESVGAFGSMDELDKFRSRNVEEEETSLQNEGVEQS